jgi:hypothetical protein
MQRDAKAVETSLRKDNGALQQQVEKLKKEVVTLKRHTQVQVSSSDVSLSAPAPPQLHEVDSLKKLVDDASLTDEIRGAAQANLQDHLTIQFEASARERKQTRRDAYLSDLVTEQHYVSSVQSLLVTRDSPEDSPSAEEVDARVKMLKWIVTARLRRHHANIVRIAGPDASPYDLTFLSEDNLEELSREMTHVENVRFTTALQDLQSGGPDPKQEPEPEPEPATVM